MIPLYKDKEFERKNHNDYLPLKCEICGLKFYKTKKYINDALNPNNKTTARFCSLKCTGTYKNQKEMVSCSNCCISFWKKTKEIKRSTNHFCSLSCSATYNNKYIKTGIKRSKFERWVEKHLPNQFPNLTFKFNDCNIIGSELDIYIPELNLAFEINGIVHYQPIFGNDKLQKIQENDKNKHIICANKNIKLHDINISKISKFNKKQAQSYLNDMKNIINSYL